MGTADRGDWLDDERSLFALTGARWPFWAAFVLTLLLVAVGP